MVWPFVNQALTPPGLALPVRITGEPSLVGKTPKYLFSRASSENLPGPNKRTITAVTRNGNGSAFTNLSGSLNMFDMASKSAVKQAAKTFERTYKVGVQRGQWNSKTSKELRYFSDVQKLAFAGEKELPEKVETQQE